MTHGDAEQVPNLRLAALQAAVREGEQALAELAPGGLPTRAVSGLLTDVWVSEPAAGRAIAALDANGAQLQTGFREALAHLRSLADVEARTPLVGADDLRGNPGVYLVDVGAR